MEYTIFHQDATPACWGELGGKARALAELQQHNLPIPPWFAVKTSAFSASVPQGCQNYAALTPDDLIPPEALVREVKTMLDRFPPETRFAVRSSAKGEDGKEASFAGQFESYLWVPRQGVMEHIKLVWLSGFTRRVMEYRRASGVTGSLEPPAVLVQRMVPAQRAGVAFAANPLNGDTGECLISAVFGLGSALVDGSSNADTYRYRYRDGALQVAVAEKNLRAEPLNRSILPEWLNTVQSGDRVLSDEQAAQVAQLARKTSLLQGVFQDIEWAWEGDALYLLQSRPITSLGSVYQEQGRGFVFDNSNIAESYIGPTTPLTFSFIRKAYAGVYEQFCRVFGVSERTIGGNSRTFAQMLAFVDNRVYYNLFSWYKMLSLLPGYSLNRQFMEQMMGVKEPLPEEFLQAVHDSAETRSKLRDSLQLVRCLLRLMRNFIGLERHIRVFLRRLETALDGPSPEEMSGDELYDRYYALERSLLKRWDAPIENDFYCMIFHGMLRSLCKKYGMPADAHNLLLTGQGGIISAKPAALIQEISRGIAGQAEAVRTLGQGSLLEINQLLARMPELREKLSGYLREFGDRCANELKLESVNLREDPLPLYRAVAASAAVERTGAAGQQPPFAWRSYLKGHPLRRAYFSFVLKHARRLVKNRENLRFERTRLFGHVRDIYLSLGMHLASRGILEHRRDIFYLTLEEILGAVDMTAASYALRETVELRKKEEAVNRDKTPPGRIYAAGIAGFSPRRQSEPPAPAQGEQHTVLHGTPCCAGKVTARARLVSDPGDAGFQAGEILVARSTDPGWIILFSLAAGIVVEKGSLLSHAAIVSREMGIPCVIAAENAMAFIPDGATVTLDGAAGTVQLDEEEEDTDAGN